MVSASSETIEKWRHDLPASFAWWFSWKRKNSEKCGNIIEFMFNVSVVVDVVQKVQQMMLFSQTKQIGYS